MAETYYLHILVDSMQFYSLHPILQKKLPEVLSQLGYTEEENLCLLCLFVSVMSCQMQATEEGCIE